MTSTTIKVSTTTRDLLRQLAKADGVTMDAALVSLLDRESRRRRMEAARRSIEANPPDAEYIEELRSWTSEAWS